MTRRLRVLHAPTNTGGNPAALARAERALGLDSLALAWRAPRLGPPPDRVIFRDGETQLGHELRRLRTLVDALRCCDVVHFNFGESFYPPAPPFDEPRDGTARQLARRLFRRYLRLLALRDLPLLRRAGKGIVVTYQGSDARQDDVCAERFAINHLLVNRPAPPEVDRTKRAAIAAFDRYADRIFALNPDLLHVLPARAEFLPYASVDPRAWRPEPTAQTARGPLRLVHAPSRRHTKGTELVLAALRDAAAAGAAFEVDLVEGVPHAEVRARFARADLAIDQLLLGWYGGVAVELMALAVPVVAFIRDGDLGFLPAAMRDELPILRASPSDLTGVLVELHRRGRGWLREQGQRSRAYVERWHDPALIAARLVDHYTAIIDQRRRRSRPGLRPA